MAIDLCSMPASIRSIDRSPTFSIVRTRRKICSSVLNRRCFVYRKDRRKDARIRCCSSSSEAIELDHSVKRRYSPVLESEWLSQKSSGLSSSEWKAVPDIWRSTAQKFGDRVAVVDPYHEPQLELTYKQLEIEILGFAEGLRAIGLLPDEKVALFADNSCRWLIADQGIMATGAIDVVRGARSSDEELLQIYTHSESVALVVDSPAFLNRLAKPLISKVDLRFVILLWGEKTQLHSDAFTNIPLYSYAEIVELGRDHHNKLLGAGKEGRSDSSETIKPGDIATIMYTSGTSGSPKGVMLTHENLLHQILNLWEIVPAKPGDHFLSMLPSWHAYERACEYFIFTYGIKLVYTNVKSLKEDLLRYQPRYLISVPLVYENLYSSIHKQLSSSSSARKFVALKLIKISMLYMEAKRVYEGKVLTNKRCEQSSIVAFFDWLWARFIAAVLWPLHKLGSILVYRKIHSAIGMLKAGVSGGGSLVLHVDKFFEAIGVKLQNGYGLTETSPVVAARRPSCNVLGTIGHPIKYTEIKIVDKESGENLPDGSKGIVKVRGPQVMKGYYKNPSATSNAIDEEGWFNTGDIGWIAPRNPVGRSRKCGGMIVLEGRAKDTIVLTTGENAEPSELEEAALRSNLIQQIVVIGQDRRRLGALIFPNKDELLNVAKAQSIVKNSSELTKDKVLNLLYSELRTWTLGCSFQIGPVLVVDEPFTIENGLMTPTMKVRRDKVVERYRDEIEKLYK